MDNFTLHSLRLNFLVTVIGKRWCHTCIVLFDYFSFKIILNFRGTCQTPNTMQIILPYSGINV